MARVTPINGDPEERARQRRDPDGYDAMERLHDAYDGLTEAMDRHVNEVGMRLFPRQGRPPERLVASRERLDRAEEAWHAAVDRAESLLRERGGV